MSMPFRPTTYCHHQHILLQKEKLPVQVVNLGCSCASLSKKPLCEVTAMTYSSVKIAYTTKTLPSFGTLLANQKSIFLYSLFFTSTFVLTRSVIASATKGELIKKMANRVAIEIPRIIFEFIGTYFEQSILRYYEYSNPLFPYLPRI